MKNSIKISKNTLQIEKNNKKNLEFMIRLDFILENLHSKDYQKKKKNAISYNPSCCER